MWRLVSAVVAPCFSPEPQVAVPTCMPHQMPTYLTGSTQDTSTILLDQFTFRHRSELRRPVASAAILMVRQGVLNGSFVFTRIPSDQGVRSAFSVPLRCESSVMEA